MTTFVDSRPISVSTLEESIEETVGRGYCRLIEAAELVSPDMDNGDSIRTLAKLLADAQDRMRTAEDCECSQPWFGPVAGENPYWEIRHRIEAAYRSDLYAILNKAGVFEPLAAELKSLAAQLEGSDAPQRRAYLKYLRTRFLVVNPDIGLFVKVHKQ